MSDHESCNRTDCRTLTITLPACQAMALVKVGFATVLAGLPSFTADTLPTYMLATDALTAIATAALADVMAADESMLTGE